MALIFSFGPYAIFVPLKALFKEAKAALQYLSSRRLNYKCEATTDSSYCRVTRPLESRFDHHLSKANCFCELKND